MDVTKRLDKNGKVEIPGLDLTNRDELQRLTNLTRDIARSSTGGFTEFDRKLLFSTGIILLLSTTLISGIEAYIKHKSKDIVIQGISTFSGF